MPIKNNRSCKVCGDQYYYCPSCVPLNAPDRYKMVFCSLNCKNIFDVVSHYAFKKIDRATAKSKLSELDMSNRYQFTDKIKADVDEIMKSNKKNKKKAKFDGMYGSETVLVGKPINGDDLVVEEDNTASLDEPHAIADEIKLDS